jgi:hypothetical protein
VTGATVDRQRHFAAAMQFLRHTRSSGNRSIYALMIRAAVLSPAAASILVVADLRTRADRNAAIIATAAAIAAEMDEAAG